VSNVTEFGSISNRRRLEESGFFKSFEGVISSQVKSKTASSHGYSHFEEEREEMKWEIRKSIKMVSFYVSEIN